MVEILRTMYVCLRNIQVTMRNCTYVLGVEDRGENDQLDVYQDFKENITPTDDGRYHVNAPWIPGQTLPNDNLEPSPKRLANVCERIERHEKLKIDYDEIIERQLKSGIIEGAPEEPTGQRVYYMRGTKQQAQR